MPLAGFVRDLYESGRVKVPRRMGFTGEELARLDEQLAAVDVLAREELPGEGPAYSPGAAQWAAMTLYRACQFFVFRDLDERQMEELLARRCPERPSPSVSWSADLTFRFLPDLLGLARGLSERDPLVDRLRLLATDWPLSSPGVRGVAAANLDGFMEDACLLRLYADRVLARADLSRLDHPAAREAVKAALGAHPDLAPAVRRALEDREEDKA